MSKLLSVLIAAVYATTISSAIAAEGAMAPAAAAEKPAAAKKINPQHAKMKNCNKKAKEQGLKKDERKAFMKSCLKKDA